MELTLTEGLASTVLTLSSEQASALASIRRSATGTGRAGTVFTVSPVFGGYQLTSRGYIGSVVAADLKVVVRPRFSIANLAIMQRAGSAAAGSASSAISVRGHLDTGYLVEPFAYELEQLLVTGLPEEYIEVTERSFNPRGAIRFGDFDASLSGSIAHSHYAFSRNTAFNALLRDAATVLHSLGIERAREWIPAFSEVRVDRVSEAQIELIDEPRLRRLADMASHIILGAGADLGFHTSSDRGLLIKVSSVFEAYIRSAATTAATERGLIAGRGAGRHIFELDESVHYSIELDFLAQNAHGPALGIDAKYKFEEQPPASDVYQAMAYAARLGLADFHLVYPGRRPSRTVAVLGQLRCSVHQHWLDLDSSDLVGASDRLLARVMS